MTLYLCICLQQHTRVYVLLKRNRLNPETTTSETRSNVPLRAFRIDPEALCNFNADVITMSCCTYNLYATQFMPLRLFPSASCCRRPHHPGTFPKYR